jgi:sulfite exporter TauE/SafE/copper chaperone CopZ
MQKVFTFYISGMHCKACELLSENEVSEIPGIISVKSDIKNSTIMVAGDFGDESSEGIAKRLDEVLKKHGYTVSVEKTDTAGNFSNFKIAIPVALIIVLLFFFLQRIGLVNFISSGTTSYTTIFLIGIVASLSSCMAVVGGLLLSVSATFAKSDDKIKPQILFHIGRLLSFFFLGGLLGALGATLTINNTVSLVLGFAVALVMIVLGLNLLGIFKWTKNLTPGLPKFISKRALGISKLNHSVTPFLVGVVTFFLPCGFTQSMQILSLSSGSSLSGALIMFVFALGTLPVLALISFSFVGFKDKRKSDAFFKTAGLIVLVFAVINLINAFVSAGIMRPIFNF